MRSSPSTSGSLRALGTLPPTQPPLTQDAALRLVSDRGTVIEKSACLADRVVFMVPPGLSCLRLVSRTSRPCDVIGPFVDDRRDLGVLVGEMVLETAGSRRALAAHLHDPSLDGWDVVEAAPCRWTNGAARLPLGEHAPTAWSRLTVQILAGGPYVLSADWGDARLAG